MAKNRNKKNNARTNTPVAKTAPSIVAAPKMELSEEDKNRLYEEYKTKMIAEGQKERDNIIEQGKIDAENKARVILEEAERTKDEELKTYRQRIEDKIRANAQSLIEDAKVEADRIRQEAATDRKEAKKLQEHLATESENLEGERTGMINRKAKLASDEATYRERISREIAGRVEELEQQNATLEGKNATLERELDQKRRFLKYGEDERTALEQENDKHAGFQRELLIANHALRIATEAEKELRTLLEDSQSKLSLANAQVRRYGENPDAMQEDIKSLKAENEKLDERLRNCSVTESDLKMLRDAKDQNIKLQNQVAELKKERDELKQKYQNAEIYHNDLEHQRRFIKILLAQRAELQHDLDNTIELYGERDRKTFAELSKIDKQEFSTDQQPARRQNRFTLEQFCTDFRNYLASRRDKVRLFYSERHIRTFISAFAATRLIILQGMSGTGKSSLPRAFMDFMNGGCETTSITVQASWKDRNDLLGFYNDFEKRYKETNFLKALYEACCDQNRIHCIMLDEMNISRIEYYFADFIDTLEKPEEKDWKISLLSDNVSNDDMPMGIRDGKLCVRKNTWFIGTANRDDSTFTITDKVYDRAIVLDFSKREEKPERETYIAPMSPSMNRAEFQSLLDYAPKLSQTDENTMNQIMRRLDDYMSAFKISFGNRIDTQIKKFVPVYCACGGSIREALDVIFATKVLRKLDYGNVTKEKLETLEYQIMVEGETDFANSLNVITEKKSDI